MHACDIVSREVSHLLQVCSNEVVIEVGHQARIHRVFGGVSGFFLFTIRLFRFCGVGGFFRHRHCCIGRQAVVAEEVVDMCVHREHFGLLHRRSGYSRQIGGHTKRHLFAVVEEPVGLHAVERLTCEVVLAVNSVLGGVVAGDRDHRHRNLGVCHHGVGCARRIVGERVGGSPVLPSVGHRVGIRIPEISIGAEVCLLRREKSVGIGIRVAGSRGRRCCE